MSNCCSPKQSGLIVPSAPKQATYVTEANELVSLPNSFQLVPGNFTTINTTTPHHIAVDAFDAAIAAANIFGNNTGASAPPVFFTVGTTDQVLGVAHTGGGLEGKTIAAGFGISVIPTAGTITISNTGSISINPTPYTTNTILTGTEQSYLIADVTTSGFTFTLPAAASFPGKVYWFEVTDPTFTEHRLTLQLQPGDQTQQLGGSFTNTVDNVVVNSGPSGYVSDGVNTWWPLTSPMWNTPFVNNVNAVWITDFNGVPQFASTVQPNSGGPGAAFVSNLILSSDPTGLPVFTYGLSGINDTPITANTTLTGFEASYQLIDSTTNPVTITLPATTTGGPAGTPISGKIYYFTYNAGANVVTITTDASDINGIAGSPSIVLTIGQMMGIISSPGNTEWFFVAKPA
jgi:hypothetical protein